MNYNFNNGSNRVITTQTSADFELEGSNYTFNYIQDETGSADGDFWFEKITDDGARELDAINPFDEDQFEGFKEQFFEADVYNY